MKKFYITSAIPYVNAAPHIGHAQEFVYADVTRRHAIAKHGEVNVRYLCGADENALKIVQAAEKTATDPQKFCDLHNAEFLALAGKLNVHIDIWQRGTDRTHHFPSSQKLWQLCAGAGDIYKKSYEGLYCVGCEAFYTPDELDENGECFEHPGRKLDKISEENYFFRLSKYQKYIEELLLSQKLTIVPEIRKNEALAFVRKGLNDFSVSRSITRAKGWGVPVPDDPGQIMYVWFDALNIYQSGIGLGWDEKSYQKWAPQDVMVIGKGIIRFHAIYWPAILKSAGLPIPQKLFAHGYLTVNGAKMSKTLGNVVDPLEVISKYGTDAVRYYLLREIPSYSDGDYSERRFREVYNSDLANGLGNLVARVAKLSESLQLKIDLPKVTRQNRITRKISPMLDVFQFDKSLEYIWTTITELNKYLDLKAPWKQTPSDGQKTLQTVLHGSGSVISLIEIAEALSVFLPETSDTILRQFKGPNIKSESPLFPRLT